MWSEPALLQRCYSVVTDLDLTVCLFTITCINTRHGVWPYPANKKKLLYNICTMLGQRRRRWADAVQMLYKCFVFLGIVGSTLAQL